MLAGLQPCLKRSWRTFASVTAAAALGVPLFAAPAMAGVRSTVRAPKAAKAFKQVSYRGYSFEVPRSWRVIDLSGTRRTCVRFDRHVIYLGRPAADLSCPSYLIGTTEAMLVQPGPKSSARSSVEDPVGRKVTVTEPRIKITATFDDDRSMIFQILASASLPTPIIRMPRPVSVISSGPRPAVKAKGAAAARAATTALSEKVANYQGVGFDSCAAPDAAYMRAWRAHSPFRAVGVYIGGSDESCDQPNLTRAWLRREAAAGWHFIPMYVGPQAEFGELHNHPGHQGRRAANDAVMEAERLGLGPWTPIYYDMEAYLPRKANKALRFLSSWTSRLHALGYSSGIYSSSDSGITDLAQRYYRHKWAIPDVIYDALWNGKKGDGDAVIGSGEWADHHRVHQYAGNVSKTYGRDTLNIDDDYMNVLVTTPSGTPPASPGPTNPVHPGGGGGGAGGGGAGGGGGSPPPVESRGVADVFYPGSDRQLSYLKRAPGWGWVAPSRR
jgi:hypothetical protein